MKRVLTIGLSFILILAIFIACRQNKSNSNNPVPKNDFATLPVSVPAAVIAGEGIIESHNLELLGVIGAQGQVVPVAKEIAPNTIKMGFVALEPSQNEVVKLVFRVEGNNARANISSLKGVLPSRESQNFNVVSSTLRSSTENPLDSHNPKKQTETFLASQYTLNSQNVDSSNINLVADFANFPLGDVNKNGNVDFDDAIDTLLISFGINSSVPTDHQLYHADINCSGRVDFDSGISLLLKSFGLLTDPILQVCPQAFELNSGDSELVLAGNRGNGNLPSISFDKSPSALAAQVKDITPKGAVGKVYQVDVSGNNQGGKFSFKAGDAGSADVNLTIGTPFGGPEFVINSPPADSAVGSPIFFSVQPFNSSEVDSVTFKAGDTVLGNDVPYEDNLKVFLEPKDFPAGDLDLTAIVTGTNGKQSQESINVKIVKANDLEEQATVGAEGAVLGTVEKNGSTSVLTVPAEGNEGVTVTFESKTKEQVKDETGVDYDALGVTFLGAQKVTSSEPLEGVTMVASGGFGPMVQPGQAVVNYMIGPDGDGDGIGELVVVNTASVAPNGDVISDPLARPQLLNENDNSGILQTSQLELGEVIPGQLLIIRVNGFNLYSSFGNVARFTSNIDNTEVIVQGVIRITVQEDENVYQEFIVTVPQISQGPASLILSNESTGLSLNPISLQVGASPTATGDYIHTIETYFTLLADYFEDFVNDFTVDLKEREKAIFMKYISLLRAATVVYPEVSTYSVPEVTILLQQMAAEIEVSGLLNEELNYQTSIQSSDGCGKSKEIRRKSADFLGNQTISGTQIAIDQAVAQATEEALKNSAVTAGVSLVTELPKIAPGLATFLYGGEYIGGEQE